MGTLERQPNFHHRYVYLQILVSHSVSQCPSKIFPQPTLSLLYLGYVRLDMMTGQIKCQCDSV